MAAANFSEKSMNVGNIGLHMDQQGASRLHGALAGNGKTQSGDLSYFIPMAVNPAITNVLSVIDEGAQVRLKRSMADALFYNAAKGVLISLVSPVIRTDATRINYTVESPIIQPAQLTTLGTVGQINADETFSITTDSRMIGTTMHSALDTVLKTPTRLYNEAYKNGISMLLTFNQLVVMNYMVNGIISLYFVKGVWHHQREVKADYLFATNKLFMGMANDSMERFLQTVNEFRADLVFAPGRSQAYLLAPLREATNIVQNTASEAVKEYVVYTGMTGFQGEIILPNYAPSTRMVASSPDAPIWNVTQLNGILLAVVPGTRLSRGINLGNLLENTEANPEFYYHPQREAWGNPKDYPNKYELGFYNMPADRQFYLSMSQRLNAARIFDPNGDDYHPDFKAYIAHLNASGFRPTVNDRHKAQMMANMLRAPEGIVQNIKDYKGEPVFTYWDRANGKTVLAKDLFSVSMFTCHNSAVVRECRKLAHEKRKTLDGVMLLTQRIMNFIKTYVVPGVRSMTTTNFDDARKTGINLASLMTYGEWAFLSLPSLVQSGTAGLDAAVAKTADALIELAEKVSSAVYSDPLFALSPLFNEPAGWMPAEPMTNSAKLVSAIIANLTDFVPLFIDGEGPKTLSARFDPIRLKQAFASERRATETVTRLRDLIDNLTNPVVNPALKEEEIKLAIRLYLESGATKKVDNLIATIRAGGASANRLTIKANLKLQEDVNDIEAVVDYLTLVAVTLPKDATSELGFGRAVKAVETIPERMKASSKGKLALAIYNDLLGSSSFGLAGNKVPTAIVVPVSATTRLDEKTPFRVLDPTQFSYYHQEKSERDAPASSFTAPSPGKYKKKSKNAYDSDESDDEDEPRLSSGGTAKSPPSASGTTTSTDLDVDVTASILDADAAANRRAPLTRDTSKTKSKKGEVRGAKVPFQRKAKGPRLFDPETSDFWQAHFRPISAYERDDDLHLNYAADMQSTTGIVIYAYLSLPINYINMTALADQAVYIPCDFFVIRPQINRYSSPMLVADGAMRAFVNPTNVASEFDEIRNTFTSTTKVRIGMAQLTFPNNFTFRGAFLRNNEYGMSAGIVHDTMKFAFADVLKSYGLGINEPSVFVLAISPTETLYQGFCWTGEKLAPDYLTIAGISNVQMNTESFSMLPYYRQVIPAFAIEIQDSKNKLSSTVNSFATKNPAKTTIIHPIKMLSILVFTQRFNNLVLAGPRCTRHDNAVNQTAGASPHGQAKHQREGCRDTWIGKRIGWYDGLTSPGTRSFARDQT